MDDRDRINKQSTDEIGDNREEFEIESNVREKDQDPSPADRERGERSDAEPEGSAGGAGGTTRR